MYLPNYINELSMEKFVHTLDDTTECYKFYWFHAILEILAETGRSEIEYDDIINVMIADAWYSVSECHLHLGLKDATGKIMNSLERAVNKLMEISDIPSDAEKELIIQEIIKNKEVLSKEKYQITKNVPYRFLSPFLNDLGGNDAMWDQKKRIIAYIELINKDLYLPYRIIDGVSMKKKIVINEIWMKFFIDNYPTITGWIRDKKVKYLQDRNPNVPGIIYKLESANAKIRKLKHVRGLWNNIIKQTSVQDIYTKKEILNNEYDVDHFVPWSYVANDELWNLLPMESSLNCSKSNKLPQWDKYFKEFANNQYVMYSHIYSNMEINNSFQKCRRDNLFSIWANEELYIEGHNKHEFIRILEHYLKPIHASAKIQGYKIWNV